LYSSSAGQLIQALCLDSNAFTCSKLKSMVYILTKDRPNDSYEEWQAAWSAYCYYLDSVAEQLPQSAYDFATAPWHYDFGDHRAPHDGWLESLIAREAAPGERKQNCSVEIVVRLFAAYHDGHIELNYFDVQSYSLSSSGMNASGHGDWLHDEIRLSEEGRVLHEVEWSEGSLWLIECGDIAYQWIPLESAKAAI
jgi:hypothetical protein